MNERLADSPPLPLLEQVETLLKTQEPAGNEPARPSTVTFEQPQNQTAPVAANFNATSPGILTPNSRNLDRWRPNAGSPPNSNNTDLSAAAAAAATASNPVGGGIDDFSFNGGMSMGMNDLDNSFTWEMIGLGLEEPLPPQDTIDELYVLHRAWFLKPAHKIIGTRYTSKRSTHLFP